MTNFATIASNLSQSKPRTVLTFAASACRAAECPAEPAQQPAPVRLPFCVISSNQLASKYLLNLLTQDSLFCPIAADLQSGNFARSEFEVAVTNWSVSGTKLQYSFAGTGSRRIEDDSAAVAYAGNWTESRGNYSGGSIRWTNTPGARASCTYSANGDHWLCLGTRLLDNGGQVAVQVDGSTPAKLNLLKAAEDGLVRLPGAAVP